MLSYIVRRIIYMFPLMLIVSVMAFAIVRFQPGDFLAPFRLNPATDKTELKRLEKLYGLDQPFHVQYYRWIAGIVTRLDFGYSFQTRQPVLNYLFGEPDNWFFYLRNTATLIFATTLFSWLIALPIGIYSATHKYTIPDHTFTFLGFLGLSVPNFFFALALLWALVSVFKVGTVGLSIDAAEFFHPGKWGSKPWDMEKSLRFLWHLWPAVLIIGSANMAMLVRYMRGNMLDVLSEPYIQTARSKGLRERIVVYKHALRNAINPLISILGFWIPSMFEGTLVAVVVLNWPTVERIYWRALYTQDQYVIMSGLLFFGFVLLAGNLIADVLLAWADPKIRYE